MGPLRARVAWDFISKPNSLFHRCMERKYGNWPWVNEFVRGDSAVWRLICHGAISLSCCVRWQVCNGDKIDILNHIWIWDRALSSWSTFCDIAAIEDHSVSELLTLDGGWNEQKLRLWFGESLVERILEIKICNNLGEDTLELTKCPIGSTVSALVYNIKFQEEDDPSWAIQKSGLRPKEKLFWWRIYRNIIPTNCWLHARGFVVDVQCPVGCCMDEDLNHVTTRCKQLLDILDVLNGWGFHIPRFTDFHELQVALKEDVNVRNIGLHLYCVYVYHSWLNRNAIKHGKDRSLPVFLAASVLERINQGSLSFNLEQRDTSQSFGLCSPLLGVPPPYRLVED
ncbi:hypothetical protein MA16_Dca027339 [Dendrobium catenatum]|uniref:Reverse transcriptase zinc-binding domain-containing protein n=1 Tax=Dendrobium catenatum TaxID=906689 RepID=A0A2I0VHC9_9ASPA|nr:hypothetical protein MA16_Dca027339 [Dendrobium catenatum]